MARSLCSAISLLQRAFRNFSAVSGVGCRSLRNLFAQDQSAGVAARKVQSAGLFVLAAQLFDGTARCGQFFLTGRALHGKEVSPYLYQRQAVFGQHGQRSHSPGSSTLNGSYGEFDAGVRQLAGVLTGMLGNLSVLTDGVNQLAAQYVQLDDGLNAYTDGVAQLKAGVAQLAEGASQLTGGTGELRSSVSGIDMGAQLDGLLNSLSGGGEVQSFTSAENTEVGAVQFALQTTAITAPAPAAQPEPAAVTLTFWQKLLKLFGLYKG